MYKDPTQFRERFKNWKETGEYELPRFGDGKEEEIQQETDKQKKWLNYWLQNRVDQFADNIDDYTSQIYRGSTAGRWHVGPIIGLDLIPQYRRYNAKNIINEQLEFANKVPIYDLRIPWQIEKARPTSYNFNNFLQMNADTEGAYFRPTYKNKSKDAEIFISPISIDKMSPLHEITHSATDEYNVQQSTIDKILGGYSPKSRETYKDKYYDNSDEVYSRLMEFRYANKLNPKKKITKQDLNKWRKSGVEGYNLLNRYDDNTLLRLFNEVAKNKQNLKNPVLDFV